MKEMRYGKTGVDIKKTHLYKIVRDTWCRCKAFRSIKYCVNYDYKEEEHEKRFGNKFSDVTFYVIRRYPFGGGLLSNYHYVLNHVVYAVSKGYVPVVDMQNYQTYYNDRVFEKESGILNAWEYYFEQPCGYSIKDIEYAQRVILGGFDYNPSGDDVSISDSVYDGKACISEYYKIASRYCKLNQRAIEHVEREKEILFGGKKNILGVLHRGTDMKTAYDHYTPSSIEQTIDKAKDVFGAGGFEYIFVCSEEQEAVDMFRQKFPRECIIVSEAERFKNYGGRYGSVGSLPRVVKKNSRSVFKSGLDYLKDMCLLATCDGIISSKVNGATFALGHNNNKYKYVGIFDLGINN